MIARLGVSIHSGEVRALLVQRGVVRWHASVSCELSGATASETFASLLATLPKRVGIRRATVAIGPAWCQVKHIEGLPAVRDLAMLTRLLHENSMSFFLRIGGRLAVSDIVRHTDGALWAAAFDQDVATSAIEALKRHGFANARIVPSVSAVSGVAPAGVHVWCDGEHVIELTIDEHRLLKRVRRVSGDDETRPPKLSGPLAKLGDDAWVNAAAFGAATSQRRTPFAWRPAPDPRRVARAARLRVGVGALFVAAASAAALMAPGLRAAQTVRDGSAEMNALRSTQTEVERTQGELRRIGATLDRVERFREQRGKTTLLLGAISQALPESTALVTLRLDSLDGNFVALTPHAADILPQLASVTGLIQPRIVGSLTKEMLGAAQLERATVRFRRPPATPTSGRGSRD
jgi:hypothetical protein